MCIKKFTLSVLIVLLGAFLPGPIQGQELIRVTDIEAPLKVLSAILISGDWFPKVEVNDPFNPEAMLTRLRQHQMSVEAESRSPRIEKAVRDLLGPGLYRPRFGPDPFTGIFKTSSGDLTLPPPADKFSAKEVARFQQALSRLGYPLKVDGKYGNETKEAIRKLQLRNGYYDLNSL